MHETRCHGLSKLLTSLCCIFLPLRAAARPSIAGTWFGTIVLTEKDGQQSHDTAVLVIETRGHSISGAMGRTVDGMTAWTGGLRTNDTLTFHLAAGGGLDVRLRLHRTHLTGTAAGKQRQASFQLRPAPGLLPHDQLQAEIKRADEQLFGAFERCDVPGYAALLSKDLEFYGDHTGKTNYLNNLQALKDRCHDSITLRRTLDKDTLVINAIPGAGAVEAGVQHFHSTDSSGKKGEETTARFTNLWSKQDGVWKLVRVVSYDHH